VLGRATASGLAGWLLRAHRPVAAAEDAGGHVSRTACGRFLVPVPDGRAGVRRRSRPAGIPLGCFHLGDSRIRLVFWEVKGRWDARPGTSDRSARATAGGPSDAPGGRWAGRPGRLAPGVLMLASWREQEVSGRRRRPRGGWPRDWPR